MIRAGIVVPYYDHPQALPVTVAALKAFSLPCWIVDDGSSPAAQQVAQRLAAQEKDWLRLLTHATNQGKGAAVLTGCRALQQAGCTHAIQIDADGQHNFADIPALLTAANKRPEALVLGQPQYDESVPKSRLYGRYLTHVWVWINTLSFDIRDAMCGFRVYPLDALLTLVRTQRVGLRMDFDVEIAVRLHWRATPVVTVPTQVRYPMDGLSHFRLWRDNALIAWMHTRLFFGMLVRLPWLLTRGSTKEIAG